MSGDGGPYELKISKNEKDIFSKKSMGLFSLQNLQRGKESGESSCWQEIHGSVFITELANGHCRHHRHYCIMSSVIILIFGNLFVVLSKTFPNRRWSNRRWSNRRWSNCQPAIEKR